MERAKCERRRPPQPGLYPWLVYYHGRRLRDQTFCTMPEPNNSSSYCVRIPELRDKYVWNCCHGWVILSDARDRFFRLWNPVTFESICLPPLELNPKSRINDCILSSPPGDSHSTILLFDEGLSSIRFCRLEDKQWIEKGYALEIKTLIDEEEERVFAYSGDYSFRQVSCVDGKLYATTFPGTSRLVMIELIEPNVLAIRSLRNKLPSANVQLGIKVIRDLVESCGELFAIEIVDCGINHPEAITIDIFRLDFSSMVWNRVDSVKDRVFFLDPNKAFSCSASNYCSEESAGNRVYFTLCEDKSLYSYNIEDGSVSVSLPRQNLPTPWKAPIWIMPNISDTRDKAAKEEQGSVEREEVQKAEKHSKEGMEETAEIEKKKTEIGESGTTQFSDLPVDILKSFSHLLTLVDYMSFRAVCKSCLLVAPPIKWRTAMSGTSKCKNSLPPWLLTIERSTGNCSLVNPKHGDRYLVSIPKPLQDATLCLCKDGWLMMCKREPFGGLCVFFFNPFTKEIIQYPELPGVGFSFVSFSSTPTSSNCVVFVAEVWGKTIGLFVCRSREEGWSTISLESDSDFTACLVRNYTIPIFINESFYFLSEEGNIGILRLGDEDDDCSWEVIGNLQKPCNSFNRIFLTECNGELISVFIGRLGKSIKIFKLNTSTMAWERVKDLGNHTIYYSRSSALSTEAKALEMANRIYFPRFCGQHLVSYSLSRDEYQSLGNQIPFHDYYGTREPLMCSWIEPTWS